MILLCLLIRLLRWNRKVEAAVAAWNDDPLASS